MRALAPRAPHFHGHGVRRVDDENGDPVESAPSVVGRRGASGRLLRKARRLIDPDEVLELALGDRILFDAAPVEAIRERVRPGQADGLIAVWRHLYESAPLPVQYQPHVAEWRAWFEAEGLNPGSSKAPPTPKIDGRSAYDDLPAWKPRVETDDQASRSIHDYRVAQHEAIDRWRAKQTAALRALWAESFHEGVSNFAEQYPEMISENLAAELDAEDEYEDAMGPHFVSIGKMVGELSNLLMAAPAIKQITTWFDKNASRIQQQAETLAWQAEQKGYRQAGANQGMLIEWESEGDDRVCDDCTGLEAGNPYTDSGGDNPLPALPGDGSTVCGPNCRCSLNYLEPDESDLASPLASDQADAGDLVDSSSEAIPGALGVDSLDELEGGSLVDTFDELATRSRNRDVEIGFALDRRGKILVSALGNADSIDFTEEQLVKQRGAALVVHNHPLSVSFSPTDVAFAFTQGVGEMRVVSPLWDYRLRPVGKRFVAGDAAKVLQAAQDEVETLYPQVKERATLAYHEQFKTPGAEHLSYAELFRRESTEFWHDVWTRTEKTTGLFRYQRTVAPKLAQMVHVQPATVTHAQVREHHLKAIGQMPLNFPKDEGELMALEHGVGPSGANEGWWLKGKTGERYYVKPMSGERAANEIGALRVYEAFGAVPGKDIPYATVVNRVDDKPVVVSRYVEDTVPRSASWWEGADAEAARTDARRFWAVDALLSHYDVVGANPAKGFDNLILRGSGGAFRVEGGGAMQFSGLGAQKATWKVGAPWVEPWTMRGLAHDGIPGGATVKPVFGSISHEKAAELLGQLQHLDRDALAVAWKDAGMKVSDIIDNLAVINSRIAQIPTIQEKLGFAPMVKGAEAGAALAKKIGVYGAPAPPPAIASKVVYKKWNPTTDKYGKQLAVQLKPFFEDFKKFNPIVGKASRIVEELAAGVTFPAYAIQQGEAKIARLKLRVAFARSYNYALGVPVIPGLKVAPAVEEFWKVKLGLVETKSVDVPHVVSTWLPKPADQPPVHTIATALPKYDPILDPQAHDFLAAHADWGKLHVSPAVWKEAKAIAGAGEDVKGWALGYNAALEGSPSFAAQYPAMAAWWKNVLGDLPAQPVKVESVATVAQHEKAVQAAVAGPYDDVLAVAKDEISKGGEPEDALANLAYLLTAKGDHLDSDDLIHGLVKFGLAGDDASAANLVADWMATAHETAEPTLPTGAWLKAYDSNLAYLGAGIATPDAIESQYLLWKAGKLDPHSSWGEAFKSFFGKAESEEKFSGPTHEAFVKFKADHPSGDAVPSLKEFEETYADWVAGGDQASWMPTPVTKWFDAHMAKPVEDKLIAGLHAAGVGSSVQNYIDHYEWLYKGGPLPSGLAGKGSSQIAEQKSIWKEWFEEKKLNPQMPVEPTTGSVIAKAVPVPTTKWIVEHDATLNVAWIDQAWVEFEQGKLPPSSDWNKAFQKWIAEKINEVEPTTAGLSNQQQFTKNVLESSGSDEGKVYAIQSNLAYDHDQAELLVKAHNIFVAESATGATDDQLVANLLASGLVESGSKAEAEMMVAAWKELGIKVEPDLAHLGAVWAMEFPGKTFGPWYQAWTKGEALPGLGGPIVPSSPAGQFFTKHGVPSGIVPPPTLIEYATPLAPGVEAVSVAKVDQLYGLLKADWPSMAQAFPPESFAKAIADYQAGKTNESWTTWFQQHAPEIQVSGKDVGQKEVAAVSFTQQTTLLAWSPTNDKWAKKFGKAHPKLYNAFKVFQAKPWVAEITKGLEFPAYAQKNPVKLARLRLKVALARTYNMALKGQYAELGALDPKLPIFWKGKLGAMGMGVEQKVVGPVDASLANLNATKELLRTTQGNWYPDFRSTFGHTVTMKIVPEYATADIAIPANSTKERELRALAYAKSYLMAKAGDVAGLRAIDERLLYFWDEKLGGGLAPKVAVSLEGAPWVHDYAAMYKNDIARYGGQNSQTDAKYERSTRAADYKHFKHAVQSFTAASFEEIREAAKSILRGGVPGRYGPMAKALVEAIQDAPATAPQLIRHESWESVARRAGSTRQGLEAFFASKAGTDYAFTMDLVSTQYAGNWQGDLKWVIEPGAKAVFAQPISSHQSENEFITAGRFKILRVSHEAGKLVVHVRQVGVFDLPD